MKFDYYNKKLRRNYEYFETLFWKQRFERKNHFCFLKYDNIQQSQSRLYQLNNILRQYIFNLFIKKNNWFSKLFREKKQIT